MITIHPKILCIKKANLTTNFVTVSLVKYESLFDLVQDEKEIHSIPQGITYGQLSRVETFFMKLTNFFLNLVKLKAELLNLN